MMWYEKELIGPRPSGASRGLQIFQTPQKQKDIDQWQKYRSKLEQNFNYSSIHGMRYVFEMGQHRWQRYFWLLIVSIAALYCLAIYIDLAKRHNEQQLITIVEDTKYPVYKINFPAVAVCPINNVNWSRAKAAVERFLPGNKDPNVEALFRKLLIYLEVQRIGNFDNLGELAIYNTKGISNISFMELSSFMAYRCYELFMPYSCIFDETTYDCCKLFVQEFTADGPCLVFNSMITSESRNKKYGSRFYPMKLSTAGEMSGLMFAVQSNSTYLRPESNIPFAVHLMIKKSIQWSERNMHKLHRNTENLISINPLMSDYSSNAYHLLPSKRRCAFDHDYNAYFEASQLEYDRKNCIALCAQYRILELCNCTWTGYLPQLNGQRECQVADLVCLYNNRDIFGYVKMNHQAEYMRDNRRGMTCKCDRNCNSLNFMLTLNVKTLKSNNNSPNKTSIIKADIHFSKRTMMKLYTKLVYTYIDLLAQFGGILGLFLGASVLSFGEVIYVFWKLLWLFIKDMHNIWKHKFNKKRVLQVTNKNPTSGQQVFVLQSRDINKSWTKTSHSNREH